MEFLTARGLRILETDWRCRLGQVDIVAEDGGSVVLVEVKARLGTAFGPPQESVDARKQRRLRRLLDAYRLSEGLMDRPCRVDVVALLLDRRLRVVNCEHIQDAVGG